MLEEQFISLRPKSRSLHIQKNSFFALLRSGPFLRVRCAKQGAVCVGQEVWRLWGFDMHEQFPPVLRLPSHWDNQQYVRWNDQRSIPEVVCDEPPDTPLTAWLKSNTKPEHQFGEHILYSDSAVLFAYNGRSKEWKVCKRVVDTVVGCMCFIMFNAAELYFLRLLSNRLRWFTSFAYIRTLEGTEYATYQQAYNRPGLLQNDNEWHACLIEAVVYYSAARLRLLSCTILDYNSPKNTYKLWLTFEDDFIGDLMYHTKQKRGKHRLPNHKDVVADGLIAV